MTTARYWLFLLLMIATAIAQGADVKPLVKDPVTGVTANLPAGYGLQTSAPTTANPSLNLPHGTAPTSPANGDLWTTTAGIFAQINGGTVGPFAAGGGGTIGGSIANHQVAVGSGTNTISGTGGLTLNGNLFQNSSSAGNALLGANAVTGSSAIIDLQVNSVQQYQLLGSATTLTLTDMVNSFNPLVYTAGTTSTSLFQAASRFRFSAANTARSSINLPAGTAPTSPLDGDMWTTTAGVFAQISGSTVGPFAAAGSGITGTLVSGRVPFANGTSSVTDSAQLVFSTASGLSVPRNGVGNNVEFFGLNAGNTTATSINTTAVGNTAGHALSSGANDTLVGYNAAGGLTTAIGVTAVGQQPMANFTTGGGNDVAIGSLALRGSATPANNTGTENVAVGRSTMVAVTSDSFNVGVGSLSLTALAGSTNGRNTGVGYNSGSSITTGSRNTVIGGDTGTSVLSTGSGNILLGASADLAVDGSNFFVVGGTSAGISSAYIGNGVTNASPVGVSINATGGVGTNIQGANLTLAGGVNTGSNIGGSVIIQTAPAGGSGTTAGTPTTRLTINSTGVASFAGTTDATSITTGTITNAGGLGVTKRSWLGDTTSATFSGNVIAGTQDGTVDTAGQVGENQVISVTGGTNLATGGYVLITSKTLQPGVWLIGGNATINGGTTGLTLNSTIGLGVIVGGGGGNVGQTESQETVLALKANGLFNISTPWRVVNITTATTYNLNCLCSFAAGTAQGFGNICAVRIR